MQKVLYKYVDIETFIKIFSFDDTNKNVEFSISPKFKFSSVCEFRYNDYQDTLPFIENEIFSKEIYNLATQFKLEISTLKLPNIKSFKNYKNNPLATLNELNSLFYNCIDLRNLINDRSASLKSDYQKVIRIYDSFDFAKKIDNYFELNDKKAHKIREKFSKLFGVFCMTKNDDNLAMWSHYCKNGGFVIGIDISNKYFNENTTIKEIIYAKRKPTLTESSFEINNGEVDINNPIFITKDISWQYEKEYRAFRKLDIKKQSIFSFPIEIVKEITIGFTEYPLSSSDFISKYKINEKNSTKQDLERNRKLFNQINMIIEYLIDCGVRIFRILPFGKNGSTKLPYYKNEIKITY